MINLKIKFLILLGISKIAPSFCQDLSSLIPITKVFPKELCSKNISQKFPICLEIDASKSIDVYNPSLIFKWKLENEEKVGIKTEYCLKNAGNFKLKLSVFDSLTNLPIREKDTTFDINIQKVASFTIINRNGQSEKIDSIKYIYTNYEFSYPELNEDEIIVWEINQEFFLGKNANYIFDKKGFYEAICYIFHKSNSTIKKALIERFEIKFPK